ncbi:hypothetical protein I9W82_001830 [Candida metapsilosis]|uniref:Uncharacterized protein n=1 Tax=Candida metapsilosis TaxID=273372 RepID=A0A8H7ZDQ6_9ASCO|nr:hypothetical protein I9W82_001830 [Candida metapsilosis]
MKLASALKLRSTLSQQLIELRCSISSSLVIQEGMTKTNPNEAYTKYLTKLAEYESLIIKINYTNLQPIIQFQDRMVSISELILLRTEAAKVVNAIQSIVSNCEEQKINDLDEIRLVCVVDRDKYENKLEVAKENKVAIELALQEANWSVDLREE